MFTRIFLVGVGAACESPAGWVEVQRNCTVDAHANLHAALDPADEVGAAISIPEACASTLASSHGASLRSLDVDRLPIEDTRSMGDVVVAGLYDLAAADFGASADLVAIEGLSDNVVASLAEFDEPEAAAALFQYSADSIRTISLTDEEDTVGIWQRGGHVYVPRGFADKPAIQMAVGLLHEASHHFDVPRHVECFETETGFPYCDTDSRGAYGFDAAVKYSWILAVAADPELSREDCRELCGQISLFQSCDMILEVGDYLPCEDAASACWDRCPPPEPP